MFPPASGTGKFIPIAPKVIRLLRKGCANRPFYHIVVAIAPAHQSRPVIEQVGSFDPIPNEHNEKLVALNYERIRYWIGNGADVSVPVLQLLGLSGFYPIHPSSIMKAWRTRQKLTEAQAKEAEQQQDEQKQESAA